MAETLDSSEDRLVELKAKVINLDLARKQLANLEASKVGTLHQIDTYFDVPEGRLKLRKIEGKREAELIYYQREDVTGPKRSKVFILKIRKPEPFKVFFDKVLEKKVIVDKKREIYRYRGTLIHLDTVKGLGNFIEFERKTKGSAEAFNKDKRVLEELMRNLGIEERNLIKGSYGDLLSATEEQK